METDDWHEPSWIDSVAAAARNPQQWLASAMRCKRAADLLREDWLRQQETIRQSIAAATLDSLVEYREIPTVVGAAALLGGTALENLLKGIIIARDPGLVQPDAEHPDRMYNWPGGGHDLAKLAGMAEVGLLPGDEETLTVLTDFIYWAGRYPTGTLASRMHPTEDRPHVRGFISSEHFERLDGLFDRMGTAFAEAAHERQCREEDETLTRKVARREVLLQELAGLDVVQTDGVRLHVAGDAALDYAPSLVVCVACGAEITLDGNRPAAICRCGTLRHFRRDWLAGRWQAVVDVYPEPPECPSDPM